TRAMPLPAPLEQGADLLESWLHASSGARLDGDGVVLLPEDSWRQCRERLEKLWPGAADVTRPAPPRRWHDERARQAEGSGRGWHWELDRLIAAEGPLTAKNWPGRARRAHLLVQEGRRAEAAGEYRLLDVAAPAGLLSWYRHRAMEAYFGGAQEVA